jgi:hypothetical protein
MSQITLTTTPQQDRALGILASENNQALDAFIHERAIQGISQAVTFILDRERHLALVEFAKDFAAASPEQRAQVRAVFGKPDGPGAEKP